MVSMLVFDNSLISSLSDRSAANNQKTYELWECIIMLHIVYRILRRPYFNPIPVNVLVIHIISVCMWIL